MRKTLRERFETKYAIAASGCWEWTAYIDPHGYGRINIDHKSRSAHRVSYELHVGPIPRGEGYHGIEVMHKCDNRRCVNPDHLQAGTHQQNILDAVLKGRIVMKRRRGEEVGNARLTEADVLRIRADPRPQRAIARDFSLSFQHVNAIKVGKRWGHLANT